MSAPGFEFNLMDPAFRADPYPMYDFLRQYAPVFEVPMAGWNLVLLSRHADVNAALKDPRLGHSADTITDAVLLTAPANQRALWAMQRHWMLFRNPPDHTRLKGLVHKAFTPRVVERMRAYAAAKANELIDRVRAQGRMDMIADFAYPLPVSVIAELLGVPQDDQEAFKGWSRDLAGTLDLDEREETYVRGSAATVEFDRYFRDLIARRRGQPEDDVLSALIAAEEEGDKLTEDEMIATCILLLVAGHETTQNLLGNGTLALLRNPAQMAQLKADPSLVKTAVEELLRYDSPVQFTSRVLFDDVEFSGARLARGKQVGLMLGAANRDPAVFADPSRLDLTREHNPHIAFGSGIHFCLGAPLARLEAQVAFPILFERLPGMSLAGDAAPSYRETLTLRGLKALEVTF